MVFNIYYIILIFIKIYKYKYADTLMKKRCAQVTIFIIAGLVIVSIISLFFLFRAGVIPEIGGTKEINPNSFLSSCLEDKIKETTQIISLQGGHLDNPLHKTFKFEGEEFRNISYLCYTQNNYIPCVNQEPMLFQHLKEEIYDYISKDKEEISVRNCFDDLVFSLEEQGYVVNARYNDFEVKLVPKKVVVEIDGEITLTKTGETSTQEDFKVIIPSRFYDLAIVVQEIVNQEARFCNFEHLGFMFFYNKFMIDKFRTGDSTIIYTIEHKDTKEKFRFAVRSCVIPPGF